MGGDRGGGKKGGKRREKGGKKPPRPSLVSFGGPGWGAPKTLQGRSENSPPPLCLGGQIPSLAAVPLGPQGQSCVSVLGPVHDGPFYEGRNLLPSFGWAVAGGGGFASRYVGGVKTP